MKPSVESRALSGSSSMDDPDNRLAIGRRSHDSASSTASSVVIAGSRSGRPVRMHSVYGVPAGYRSTSPVGNVASQSGLLSSVAIAIRRIR